MEDIVRWSCHQRSCFIRGLTLPRDFQRQIKSKFQRGTLTTSPYLQNSLFTLSFPPPFFPSFLSSIEIQEKFEFNPCHWTLAFFSGLWGSEGWLMFLNSSLGSAAAVNLMSHSPFRVYCPVVALVFQMSQDSFSSFSPHFFPTNKPTCIVTFISGLNRCRKHCNATNL